MAIKPNDCIVPYGKLYRWVQTGNGMWDTELQFDVVYLKKFNDHIANAFRAQRPQFSKSPNQIRDDELRKYNATFKQHRADTTKDYIKFNSHEDLTYFILMWS